MGNYFKPNTKEKCLLDSKEDEIHVNKTIKLNIHLLQKIIGYLEQKTIIKELLTLNKSLYKLFNLTSYQKSLIYDHSLIGTQEFVDFDLYIDLFEILENQEIPLENLLDIQLEIEYKDQLWSSIQTSTSWIDVRVINPLGDIERICSFILPRSFYEKDYQIFKTSFNKYSIHSNKAIKLLKYQANKLQIYGRAIYPGWICYIRRITLNFLFYIINL